MPYIPRLIFTGILNNPYWYSDRNLYYANGWQLPDTRNYVYGRFWECSDITKHFTNKPNFDIRPAEQWYGHTADGYTRSQTPQLGAVACISYTPSDPTLPHGLLAVVEEITSDPVLGDIIVCCSGRPDDDDPTLLQQWIIEQNTNNIIDIYPYDWEDATFQGYIYNPITGGSLDPPSGFKPWLAKAIIRKRLENA